MSSSTAGPQAAATGTPGAEGGTGGAGEDGRTFTQADLDRIAAKEKDQGKRAGAREFVGGLGFDDPEALRTFVEEQRRKEEERLTEDQRKAAEIARREAETTRREAAIAKREADVARRAALVAAGSLGDDLEDAAALLRIEDDADPEAVTAAVEALKVRRPELFGGATTPPPGSQRQAPPPGGRIPGAPKKAPVPLAEKGARGKAEAARRFATVKTE